ncbi:MAG: twin-arginine translocase subunit TatC, partial [Gammaproteobacteria bacterium]
MSENETQEQEVGSTEQPLIAHLVELRDRLIRCFLVIVIFFLCIFPFGNELYEFIAKPLQDVLPEGSSMIATSPTSPFMIPFKTSIYAAIFIG